MTTVHLTDDAHFSDDVLDAAPPVLVDFSADWCAPCRALTPVLDDLAREWGSRIKVVKADIESSSDAADRYGVAGIPTLILFVDGIAVDRLPNTLRRDAIAARVETVLAEGARS